MCEDEKDAENENEEATEPITEFVGSGGITLPSASAKG
jgi:hypothetical protein